MADIWGEYSIVHDKANPLGKANATFDSAMPAQTPPRQVRFDAEPFGIEAHE
jgi:hypothetical protein